VRFCVFCGSNHGVRPAYRAAAEELARLLAARGHGIVYGGGSVGLMGRLADAALAEGGEVIGVIPETLATKELAHAGLSQMHVVGSMHARKALMAELADAFVAMPGGFGTFEELLEIVTWAQLGIHRKPIGVLNVAGYYGPLVQLVEHACREGLIRDENRGLFVIADEPAALLERMAGQRPPAVPKWIVPEP
jgi:uncharacterized protein (TIGR00730 family)